MPTKRTKTSRNRRLTDLSDWQVEYLFTGGGCCPARPATCCCNPDQPGFGFLCEHFRAGEIWLQYRDRLLAEWIRLHPGSRPWAWWEFDAPEERERVGGQGKRFSEYFNVTPHLSYGIPSEGWVSRSTVKNQGGWVKGKRLRYSDAIDPADPPTFEGEAAYLARFQLFVEGERPRAPKQLFSPVHVEGGPFETRLQRFG